MIARQDLQSDAQPKIIENTRQRFWHSLVLGGMLNRSRQIGGVQSSTFHRIIFNFEPYDTDLECYFCGHPSKFPILEKLFFNSS